MGINDFTREWFESLDLPDGDITFRPIRPRRIFAQRHVDFLADAINNACDNLPRAEFADHHYMIALETIVIEFEKELERDSLVVKNERFKRGDLIAQLNAYKERGDRKQAKHRPNGFERAKHKLMKGVAK